MFGELGRKYRERGGIILVVVVWLLTLLITIGRLQLKMLPPNFFSLVIMFPIKLPLILKHLVARVLGLVIMAVVQAVTKTWIAEVAPVVEIIIVNIVVHLETQFVRGTSLLAERRFVVIVLITKIFLTSQLAVGVQLAGVLAIVMASKPGRPAIVVVVELILKFVLLPAVILPVGAVALIMFTRPLAEPQQSRQRESHLSPTVLVHRR